VFCPKCKSEYRPGFTVCSDCHVQLVSELSQAPPLIDPQKTGSLEIHRKHHPLAQLRAYSILVDGIKVDRVKDGATTFIPLGPGTHSITIKIDWKKSNTVIINTEIGKTIKLNVDYAKLTGWKLYALSIAWAATALIGAIFGIGMLVGIGVVGFIFNRVGKLRLYRET
jgi:hypothetical protein